MSAQARPQLPQFAGLTRRSVSQPLVGSLSQSPKFAAQVRPQRPAAQRAVALGPVGQALPQAPQWATSVWRLTQRPAHSMGVSPLHDDTQLRAPLDEV
jgi:hypothetical protein